MAQQNTDQMYNYFVGTDLTMQVSDFGKCFLRFDMNKDGQVSVREFTNGWRQLGFINPAKAPYFFLLLERIADEFLNAQDFSHTFRIFDDNGDSSISSREFYDSWNAFFS